MSQNDVKIYQFKQKAMVVDDDAVSRQLVSCLLKKHGYTTLETSRYEEAIRSYIALKPRLIILDQNLESLSGLEVAFFIRRVTGGNHCSIYLHTTQNETELIDNINYKYIDGYVQKGDIEKLCHILKNYRGIREVTTMRD